MSSILIVDDDPSHLEFVSAAVDRAGYTVYKAQDSAQCVVLADIVAPELIVTDLAMPGFDSVVQTTRASENGSSTLIIGMSGGSASPNQEALRAFQAAGGTRLIAKPFIGGELLRLIDDLVGVGFDGAVAVSPAK